MGVEANCTCKVKDVNAHKQEGFCFQTLCCVYQHKFVTVGACHVCESVCVREKERESVCE